MGSSNVKTIAVFLLCFFLTALLTKTSPVSGWVPDASLVYDPFKIGPDFRLGPLGAHAIYSDQVFPIEIYVLALPDVGNYRVENRSEFIDGAEKALWISTEIVRNGLQPQRLTLTFDYWRYYAVLNLSVSLRFVEDWDSYRLLIETGNNTSVVNAHDEFLPVPEGYSKEEWADRIADFMFNRWGTWAHAGGYPLWRVWYENGTNEIWGELGFQQLMKHVGKGNVTCYPPHGIEPNSFSNIGTLVYDTAGFWYYPDNARNAMYGYPLKNEDFANNMSLWVYSGYDCYAGVAVDLGFTGENLRFGRYVHFGAWNFTKVNGEVFPGSFVLGFFSVYSIIMSEFLAIKMMYGNNEWEVPKAVARAEREGRVNGLDKARSLLKSAVDAFAAGDYKVAKAYAVQASVAADAATSTDLSLAAAVSAVSVVVASGVGAYYKFGKKRRSGEA